MQETIKGLMASNVVMVIWGWRGKCTTRLLLRQSDEEGFPRERRWLIVMKPSWANDAAGEARNDLAGNFFLKHLCVWGTLPLTKVTSS